MLVLTPGAGHPVSATYGLSVETESLTSCPDCGSEALRPWRESYDRLHQISAQNFRYSRCETCGLIFLSLRPIESEIQKFYPPDYGPYHGAATVDNAVETVVAKRRKAGIKPILPRILKRLNGIVDRLLPDRSALALAEFYKPPRSGALLLDFGCGSSQFLDEARKKGWRTLGMDSSPNVLEKVRAAGHLAVRASPAAWREIADESLDFVRVHHVLEHLYRPRELLRELYRKMKVGAVLHVGLPNPVGLSSRLFGARWWGLECPRHIMLFTEDVVRRMLRQTGFRERAVLRESIVKDLVRSWGYFLHDRGSIEHHEIPSIVSGALADALCVPMRIAAPLGLGDRFNVLVQKDAEVPPGAGGPS